MTHHLNTTKNEVSDRYELHHGEDLIGQIDYRVTGEVVDMFHTEVKPEHGGQGYGQQLVKYALDDAREQGLRVKPTCPFIAKYIDENDEYQDLRA